VTKTLANGMLTIRGEKRIGEHNKDKNWHVVLWLVQPSNPPAIRS
jgi:hypothetical protein